MALPPCKRIHRFLRYEGLEYTDADIADFEARLAMIHRREVHRVPVFDFEGLPDLMAEGLSGRSYGARDEGGFGQAILDLDTPGTLQFQLGRAESARQIPDKGDLRNYWMGILSAGDFLGTTPSYTLIRDPILRLCHRLIACSIAGRSQTPKKVTVTDLFYLSWGDVDSVNISRGSFGLLSVEILGGLMVISPELPIIDMTELSLEDDPVQYMGYHWLRTDDGQGRSCLYAICSDPCIIPEARQTEDWRGQHLRLLLYLSSKP
ncbi:hypothetical protein Tco_0190531 [Tanacetum coccineum]